ncbi:MAG: hypothetical protein U0798_20240 [Gemmataceae bacterium]
MKRKIGVGVAIVVAVAITAGLAPGWWVNGHATITEAAAAKLPDEVPAFYRNAGKLLAHFAGDPDRWKNRTTPTLRAAEEGNHFLDLEDLEGKELPQSSRFLGAKVVLDLKREPNKVGTLPYAIQEGYERLACAFYDYRQDPNNEAIRMKCLVYGGWLAHYTTDISMPLHTTRNYDGMVPADGKLLLQKGIHAKIDGFPEKFKITADEICRGLEANPPDDIWAYTFKTFKESHQQIEKCYQLDALKAFDTPTEESRAFILSRCRAGAQFTMDVWTAAWKKSATMPPHY